MNDDATYPEKLIITSSTYVATCTAQKGRKIFVSEDLKYGGIVVVLNSFLNCPLFDLFCCREVQRPLQ